MRIRSSGRSKPSLLLKLMQRVVTAPAGSTQIDVVAGDDRNRFICDNLLTLRRATTVLIKEPGTIRWLASRPSPVALSWT